MIEEHENNTHKDPIWKRRGPVTVVGALVIGVMCSALYDALLKPGFGVFTEKLTELLTFGSQRLADAPFASAALDPTAIPSLILLMIVVMLALFVMGFNAARLYSLRDNNGSLENKSAVVKKKISLNFLKTVLKGRYFIPALVLLQAIMMLMLFTSYNKSVLIWRVFHNDLKLIAPYIDDQTEEEYEANFSAVQSETEFLIIQKKMSETAIENGVSLRKTL